MKKISEYKQSFENTKISSEERNAQLNKLQEEWRKESWDYRDMIREIESRKYQAERDFEEKCTEVKNKFAEKSKVDYETQNEFNRIIEFMKINKSEHDLTIKAYSQHYRERTDLKPLDIIANDEYLNLQAFICDSRKPKNKYSLVIVGKTIFNKDVMDMPKKLRVAYKQ